MDTLFARIQSLCEQKNIRPGRLCNELGISRSLMTDLKMGRRSGVSAVTAQKIASYFNVSVGYLLGEEEEKEKTTAQGDGLTENQRILMEFAKSVPDDKAEMILRVMKSIVEAD